MPARSMASRIAALGAGLLVIASLASTSAAASTAVTTEEASWAPLFYDNIVTGGDDPLSTLILFTGVSVEEACASDGPPATLRIRTQGEAPADGATIVERMVTRAPFYVYEGAGLDSVEFLDAVCGSLATGGDAPTPLATGSGLVKRQVEVTFRGASATEDATDVNSAVGVVRTTDGERWAVRGEAELTLSPEFSVDHVAFEIRNRR